MKPRKLDGAEWVLAAVVLMSAATVGLVTVTTTSQSRKGAVALTALCALKLDLKSRVSQGEAFLKAHPNGAFGFSAAAIRVSIANQQATVDSLSILHCRK